MVYSYDSYARLIKVQRYPQGPSGAEDLCQQEDYYYDGTNPVSSSYPTDALGHLSAVQYWGGNNPNAGNPCDTTFTELYNYGQPGAPVGKQLQISRAGVSQTITLTAAFTYDTEGRMTGETYPSDYVGNTANLGYTFDSMGRLNTMTDKIANAAIIQGATYGPANELLTITGGNYINAWAGETRSYNSLKQLTGILAYNSPGPVSISYNYPATGNNGKIVSQTDDVSGETVTYAYDALNRLAAAATQADISASWGQSFSYDGFGNLTNVNVTLGTAPTLLASYDPGTNHPNAAGLNVDANGNPGYIPVPADGGTTSWRFTTWRIGWFRWRVRLELRSGEQAGVARERNPQPRRGYILERERAEAGGIFAELQQLLRNADGDELLLRQHADQERQQPDELGVLGPAGLGGEVFSLRCGAAVGDH